MDLSSLIYFFIGRYSGIKVVRYPELEVSFSDMNKKSIMLVKTAVESINIKGHLIDKVQFNR